MNIVRVCKITNRHVIFSRKREKRPIDLWDGNFFMPKICYEKYEKDCPFCKGNEIYTPNEILVYPKDDWKIRIVPNKYPIVSKDDEIDIKNCKYQYITGGNHYVVIESDNHCDTYFNTSPENFYNLYKSIQTVYKKMLCEEDTNYVSFFKNYQMLAGASLYHPHSQIMSLTATPLTLIEEIKGSDDYYKKNNTCPYCEMIEEQKENNDRTVYENKHFISLMPFASRYKFETWILPKKHNSKFEEEENIMDLADIIKNTFVMIFKTVGNFAYNFYLHSLPRDYQSNNYHYHFEIIPRLSGGAGFEMNSGIYVNSLLPEDAAKMVRSEGSL